jgi:hypothetical protein
MAYKKISELSGTTTPSLTGITVVVDNGITHKSTLQTLRNVLVDSGSHYFTGSQIINGDLTISGSLTAQQYILSSSISNIVIESISGSTSFGNSLDDNHIFTGSLKIFGPISSSFFVGDGSQLSNLPTNVSMFLSSSIFNIFTSSYNSVSESFDSRIISATNEQDLSNLTTTGSNIFVDNQTISGSKYLAVETIQNLSGSLNIITDGDNVEILGSNLSVLNGGIITNFNVSASNLTGSLDWINLINLPSLVSGSSQISNLGYAITGSNIFTGDETISGSLFITEVFQTTNIQGTGSLYLKPDFNDSRDFKIYNTAPSDIHFKGNATYSFFGDDTNFLKIDDNTSTITIKSTSGTTIDGSLDISGSGTLNNSNIVSSDTINKIETITSVSYASITPISGTLYIIID